MKKRHDDHILNKYILLFQKLKLSLLYRSPYLLLLLLLSLTLVLGAARNAPALTSADVVYYGSYPQSVSSADFTVESIVWRVLETSGSRELLLSEKILDAMAFNPSYSETDPYASWWSESLIRKFLNGAEYVKSVSADVTGITVINPKGYSFYEKAFSTGEGSGIIKAALDNSSVYKDSTVPPGPNTTDKIFLLSYAEAGNSAYGFVDNNSRKAELSDYGVAQGIYNHAEGNKKYGYWWLRSPGHEKNYASFVDNYGNLNKNHVYDGAGGLRPAFRLNLEFLLFTSPAAGGKHDGQTASLHKQTYTSNDKGKYEHKLTLATNTYKLKSANMTPSDIKGGQDVNITLKYEGASTGVGYHLAAVVTRGDRALYYGRIKSLEAAADKSGTVTFVIPEYHDGEEVYIFVEGRNNNGDYKTDFAGVPICIAGSGRTIKPLPKDVEEPRPDTDSITVNPSALTIVKGYDKKLTVSFAPEGALEEVAWSSNKPDFAAVDPVTGVVSALKAGSAEVTAKTKTSCEEASCTVTVIEKPLNPALILTPAAMTVSRGMTEKITAVFQDITEQPLTWSSSEPTFATVDKDGKVTAVSEGTCVITVVTEDNSYRASCDVTVKEAPQKPRLALTPEAMTIGMGMTEKIKAAFHGIVEQPLTWSSSKKSVATVGQDGTVSAVSKGNCVITAVTEDNSYRASCDVTVKEVPQKPALILTPAAITVSNGMTEKIRATFQDITEQPLTWSSSKKSVATVEQDGTVTAVSEGTCVITVVTEDNSYSASCDVTVKEAPQKPRLALTPEAMTIGRGMTEKIKAAFHGMAKQPLTWSSDNESVATVEQDGTVIAVSEGNCVITAATKDGSYSASCDVTVKEAPQKPALILTPVAMTVSRGVTEKISAAFRGMAEQPLTWSSSKESVATVDKDGTVTAKGEGTCVITAVTEDGAYSASCEVKVMAATVVHSGGSGGCNGIGAGALALLAMLPCLLIMGKRER